MKYRKKPIVVDAIQYDGKNQLEIITKLGIEEYAEEFCSTDFIITISDVEIRASVGEYIIRGQNGKIYSCIPSIFEATYEKVEE